MNYARPVRTVKPSVIYRINPEQPSVIDIKINDNRRRRWRIFKCCANANQANAELLRLEFAEMDKRP